MNPLIAMFNAIGIPLETPWEMDDTVTPELIDLCHHVMNTTDKESLDKLLLDALELRRWSVPERFTVSKYIHEQFGELHCTSLCDPSLYFTMSIIIKPEWKLKGSSFSFEPELAKVRSVHMIWDKEASKNLSLFHHLGLFYIQNGEVLLSLDEESPRFKGNPLHAFSLLKEPLPFLREGEDVLNFAIPARYSEALRLQGYFKKSDQELSFPGVRVELRGDTTIPNKRRESLFTQSFTVSGI